MLEKNRILPWLILSLIISGTFPTFQTSAQEINQTKLGEATLIAEFGKSNPETLTALMDNFSAEMNKNPTAKGYIIIYHDKELPLGFPSRFRARLQNYLVRYRNLPRERFTVLNGGLSDKWKTQLWLIPPGVKPPLTASTNEKIELNKAFLFDSFHNPQLYDDAGCCAITGFGEIEKQVAIDNFAEQLKINSKVKAYLVFYGQYCTDCSSSEVYFDSSKVIASILRREKNHLIKRHKIPASRIITVNGGYREWQEIEL